MNSELRQRVRENKGKDGCHGEKSNQCNYSCPFAIRTASPAQTVCPFVFVPLNSQQLAFSLAKEFQERKEATF